MSESPASAPTGADSRMSRSATAISAAGALAGRGAHVRALPDEVKRILRVPYGLRQVGLAQIETLLPVPARPAAGDIVLVEVQKIGKNTRLELASGRAATLHVGDLLAVVFGNRYATMQFEGYARAEGESCDLLSMGGLCGMVESRHASIPESSKLRMLGALGDRHGRPLALRSFALPPLARSAPPPRVAVVCGSSMDAGKTHTASSLIAGLRRQTPKVAGIKLTGTAAGRDTWSLLDAGACTALDFVDGGYPSTYLLPLDELLALHGLLLSHAGDRGASWVVVEIADGLLQGETAALLRSPAFTRTVDAWLFAAGDPLAALSGVELMRRWGLEPLGITGLVTMSPLGMREATEATRLPCFTSPDLHAGAVNALITGAREEGERELPSGAA